MNKRRCGSCSHGACGPAGETDVGQSVCRCAWNPATWGNAAVERSVALGRLRVAEPDLDRGIRGSPLGRWPLITLSAPFSNF